MIKKMIVSAFFLTGILSAENSIGLNINSEDLEVQGSFNLNPVFGYSGGTSFILDANYLHTDNDNLFSIGIGGENALEAAPGLIFGLGFKAVCTNPDCSSYKNREYEFYEVDAITDFFPVKT